MSTSKKYYWLKLKEDFFDDDTISYIEEQENGVLYVNFYLKLCLKSLKANGKLIRLVGESFIPYDVNSLAKLTRTPVDTVRVAMALFEKIGLVKVLETGEIYISQMSELIGKETDKAEIMRRKRAEQKALGNNVTEALPECYTEIEIEKEKDKEIDIKDKENENDNDNGDSYHDSYNDSSKETTKNCPFQEIMTMFNEICVSYPKIRLISGKRKDAVHARWKDFTDIEVFRELFEKAESSEFLKGKNDDKWKADFDWLMCPTNMPKVLENKYENRKEVKKQTNNSEMLWSGTGTRDF